MDEKMDEIRKIYAEEKARMETKEQCETMALLANIMKQ